MTDTMGKIEVWYSQETGYNLIIEGIYVNMKLDALTPVDVVRIIRDYLEFINYAFRGVNE